jgi:proton glutamate symport protein
MKNSILVKVLIAIGLAICAGLWSGSEKGFYGVTFLQIYGLIGQLFLNSLNLVVVPLVSASIITGTAKMGSGGSFGSLGGKIFGYFILTSFLAIVIGLLMAIIMEPGVSKEGVILSPPFDVSKLAEIQHQTDSGAFIKIEQLLLKVIPSNIISAAAQGQMLGLIVFCLLFGYFCSKLDPETSSILLGFWHGVAKVMMQITHLVIKALPIGVFALVAKAMATTGLDAIGAVVYFFLTVLIGLAIYAFIVLPLLLKFVAKVSPIAHIRAMIPALVTAFSTTSSAATLPITFECVEKKAGVSNRIASFILPLGTSVNLSGSALYVCIGVVFIAQVYGITLTAPSLVVIVLLTLVTSLGSAGIPSASLFSMVVILQSLGLPNEGIGMIMAVERLLDMFRTPVNVLGTATCAVLVARSDV